MGKNENKIIDALLNKYRAFNINYDDLKNIIDKYNLILDDSINDTMSISLKIEELIADRIKKDDIDCLITAIDYFANTKALFRKKKIDVDYLDKLYEDAVEYAAQNYVSSKLFRENILTGMSYLLNNEQTKEKYFANTDEDKKKLQQDKEYQKEMLELYIDEIKSKKQEKQIDAKTNIKQVSSGGIIDMANINKVKERINQIYMEFNIDENVINNILNELSNSDFSDDEIFNNATLKLDAYIADEIKNGNVEYQEEIEKRNGGLVVLIIKTENCSKYTGSQLSIFFSKAVYYSCQHYDNSLTFRTNIYNSMKKLFADKIFMRNIISEESQMKAKTMTLNVPKKTKTNVQNSTDRKVDISFLKKVSKDKKIYTYQLSKLLNLPSISVERALLGEIEVSETLLRPLYVRENVNNFEDFKKSMMGGNTKPSINEDKNTKTTQIDDPVKSDKINIDTKKNNKQEEKNDDKNLNVKVDSFNKQKDQLTKKQKEILKHIKTYIEKNKEAPSQTTIAKAMEIADSNLSYHLDKMESKGYIVRSKQIGNQRLIYIPKEDGTIDDSLQEKKLTKKQKEILNYVKTYTEKNKEAPSQKTVADEMEVTIQNLIYHLDIMESKGYIVRSKQGNRTFIQIPNKDGSIDDNLLPQNNKKTYNEEPVKSNKINIDIKTNNKKEKEKIDISFLKRKVTSIELKKILGVSQSQASNYLNGKYKISEEQKEILLKHYACKSIEELKEKTKTNGKVDISFLKGKVTANELSKILGVSRPQASRYLNDKYKISDEQRQTLLKHYACETIEELKEKIKPNEKIDISFLKRKVTPVELSKILGVSRGTASKYLNGKYKISEEQQEILFNHYGCKTTDELKEKPKGKVDISFLKGKETAGKLSKILGVSQPQASNYLNGKQKISEEQQETLFNHYGCKTIVKLKEKTKTMINNDPKEKLLGTIKYNEFKKLVQTLQKEEKEELANKLGITVGTFITNYIFSEIILPLERQQILLEYFGFKNVEDFNKRKYIVLKERLNETEENNDIELLVENEHIDKKDDCEKVTETIEEEPVENINSALSVGQSSDKLLESINPEFILPIVKSKLTKDDFLIAILLFGGYKGRYYSIEAISNFLGIEKEHVIYIKRRCLEEYKSAFDSMKLYNEQFIQSINDDVKKPLFYEKTSNE